MPDQSPAAPVPFKPVPRRAVLLLTLVWAGPLGLLLLNAVSNFHTFHYEAYELGRYAVIVIMLALAIFGLLRAFDIVGTHKGEPWFTDPVLVALALFWGLFPPMWFFVEYLSFDRGSFALPDGLQKLIHAAKDANDSASASKLEADFLASTKLYADMAAKVWVAVGAALGAVVAMVRRP